MGIYILKLGISVELSLDTLEKWIVPKNKSCVPIF